MNRFRVAVCIILILACISGQGKASGFPGQLDEFCRTAEYIVVAECVDRSENRAKLKVEIVYKAPKENPKPDLLEVQGLLSSATRFYFEKGKRYFAFVFKDGRCDRQGSHIEISKDGKLASPLHELRCLEKNTNILDALTRQVKRVLSGEYEKDLISGIGNAELSPLERRSMAIALARTNPESAVDVLADFILESFKRKTANGACRQVYMTLLSLDAGRAKDLSLQILADGESLAFYPHAAEVLAKPQCKLDDIKKFHGMLVDATERYEEHFPGAGYAHMLPVFANNECRTNQVKDILLAELAKEDVGYFDKVAESAIKLQFPESLPLLWRMIKRKRLVSDLVNLEHCIASHVGASVVYDHENFERLEVWMGENLIRSAFPEYASSLPGAEVVRVNNSLLFLLSLDGDKSKACLFAGFVRRDRKRIEHQVFKPRQINSASFCF